MSSKTSDKDKYSDKDREKDRHRDKYSDRERERDREKHRDRGDKDRERDRHRDRGDRDKGERDRDRDRDRDRRSDRHKSDKDRRSDETEKRKVDDKKEDNSKKRRRSENDDTESNSPKKIKTEVELPKPTLEPGAANKTKLQEFAALLAKKKSDLEEQKKKLLEKQQSKEDVKPKDVLRKGVVASTSIDERPRPLVVDELGRELDAQGRPIVTVIPKHATLLANKRRLEKSLSTQEPEPIVPKDNPYFDPNLAGRGRKKRAGFNWVEPGTFVKIADNAREHGVLPNDAPNPLEDMEVDESKSILPPTEDVLDAQKEAVLLAREERRLMMGGKVPLFEWWDKPYLKAYTAKDSNGKEIVAQGVPEGYGGDNEPIPIDISSIDALVLHPVPLKPASEPATIVLQPLKLTKKEHRRVIKQARASKREEEQNKIMIGLKEPPPPRVRLVNMHRVYGAEALQDPTAIETKVREEMENRELRHHQRNQERKLTPEQLKDKKRRKFQEDLSLYTYVSVYKYKKLTPKNKFKIDINAQQYSLKGCCVNGPQFGIVVVEGGRKALRKFKKLLTRRMNWNDDGAVKEEDAARDDEDDDDDDEKTGAKPPVIDKDENCCDLVWEGEQLQQTFNEFQMKVFKSDVLAKKFLSDRGCGHYWDLAKNFIRPVETLAEL
eukprot:TRINITY_DN7121_c2_g1_i1.p1 TRINITY_DN7121_c2_g1~~TRINITY_DN7121_c2_g1_i1.p1  ORF type:complete len:664 (+),score=203.64 TRINITY_DN7121_c2_g1_i1:17-2008(+)